MHSNFNKSKFQIIEFLDFFCSKTLTAFRSGDVQVLISSDGMTRGMDVEGLDIVINYDMPAYIKTYIHRAGRTARAGHEGRCYTLIGKHKHEVYNLSLSYSKYINTQMAYKLYNLSYNYRSRNSKKCCRKLIKNPARNILFHLSCWIHYDQFTKMVFFLNSDIK